ELGGSLGVPALTAWHCLALAGPTEGSTVLVSGGAGAVGHAAIQLARFGRAGRVLATVSGPEKAALARAAGADAVINYREPDAAAQIRAVAPAGVDRFIEVAIDQNLELDLAVAAPQATVVSYAADADTRATVSVRSLMMGNISLRFMLLYGVRPVDLQAAIEGVCAAVAAGALTTQPLHRYSLQEVAAAHDAVQQGVVGKVLLEVAPPT
ncbi:MAG: zinc-binding dehydrogenase, partial [Solirubrobacteraceae bacterium]